MDDESDEDEALLWGETEALLRHVAALQEEATRRTDALMAYLRSDWIHECHQASLEDVRAMGQVTFGQRLLARLRS